MVSTLDLWTVINLFKQVVQFFRRRSRRSALLLHFHSICTVPGYLLLNAVDWQWTLNDMVTLVPKHRSRCVRYVHISRILKAFLRIVVTDLGCSIIPIQILEKLLAMAFVILNLYPVLSLDLHVPHYIRTPLLTSFNLFKLRVQI